MEKTKPLALVTGASRGIGAAIAKKLGADGYHVFVNYGKNEAKAKEVLTEIESKGGSGELCGFDVSNGEAITAAISGIAKSHGPLDVLVNNAGINTDSLLVRMKEEDIDRVLGTNLKGAMICTREAAKQMMKARKGAIIQISSVVGQMGNGGQAAYSAAKAGLIGFTKSVARELAGRGVRANVIAPGFIATDMTGDLNEKQSEAILQNIPLGYIAKPEDIANSVSFLASENSRYITGQILGVNGGMYM